MKASRAVERVTERVRQDKDEGAERDRVNKTGSLKESEKNKEGAQFTESGPEKSKMW